MLLKADVTWQTWNTICQKNCFKFHFLF